MTQPKPHNYAAAVLGGFKVLQPLNLVFNGSFTVLLRFGISPSKIGCFIGDTGACKKFWTIVGDLLAIGFTFLGSRPCAGIAAGAVALVFLTNIRLFYICLRCSGNEGVRKYFFWLCVSGCINQFESVVAIPASGGAGSWYFFAMELYTIFLPSLFWIVTLFGKCFGFDIDYWKLVIQLFSMCLLTLASLAAWIAQAAIEPGNPSGANENYDNAAQAIKCALFPWFMGFVGFGMMFWLFPVVWPFMVCHYSWFRFVMLFAPILGCIATSIPWLLSHKDVIEASGRGTYFHRWDGGQATSTKVNGIASWAYHLTWLFVPGSVFLFRIIISCVHYPSGYFGRRILHSGWVVFWGSLFFFFSCSAKAFGLNGCAANALNKSGTPEPGQLGFNSSCFAISLITMTASLFTTQAYSVGVESFKCAVDSGCSWPTQGLGGFRSFWFWLYYGLRFGTKRFKESGLLDFITFIIRGFRRLINYIRNVP